jgi:hypothetical protein
MVNLGWKNPKNNDNPILPTLGAIPLPFEANP